MSLCSSTLNCIYAALVSLEEIYRDRILRRTVRMSKSFNSVERKEKTREMVSEENREGEKSVTNKGAQPRTRDQKEAKGKDTMKGVHRKDFRATPPLRPGDT